MPEERLKQLAKDLEAGRLKPVYLLEGPDEYRRRRALDQLKRVALGEAAGPEAFENLGAVDARTACERGRMAPLFVSRRVIVAAGVQDWDDDDLAALTAYLDEPSPDTVLVLWPDGKLDRRKKAYKFFDRLDAVYSFPYITGPSRRGRIKAEASRLALKLTADALDWLDGALAPDMFSVTAELEKLATYADGRELDVADVQAVAAAGRADSAYDMVRYVAAGKPAAALAAIEKLIMSGERPESLVGLLARQVRLMWLAKECLAAGMTRGEVASRLGVQPYFVGEYVDAAARLTGERLAALHRLLAELDVGVKTGRVPGEIALTLFAAQAAA